MKKLTPHQKMQAFQDRFYQYMVWNPKKGDYYTTTRNDLQLYRIIDEDEEYFYTVYCDDPSQTRSSWLKSEFRDHGFGPRRMLVHDYILGLDPNCAPLLPPDNYYPEN